MSSNCPRSNDDMPQLLLRSVMRDSTHKNYATSLSRKLCYLCGLNRLRSIPASWWFKHFRLCCAFSLVKPRSGNSKVCSRHWLTQVVLCRKFLGVEPCSACWSGHLHRKDLRKQLAMLVRGRTKSIVMASTASTDNGML